MTKLKIKNIFSGLLRGVMYLVCLLLFLVISLLIVVNLPPVQEKIAQKGIEFLNTKFKTEITVKSVEVDYFGNLIFHGVAAKDHHKLDFIKIKELKGYTNTFSLIQNNFNNIKIDQLRLTEPIIKVITYKGEDKDNFSIFIAKFKSKKPKSKEIFKMEGRLDLINGQLSIANQNLPAEDQIWLDAYELNLKVHKVFIKDSDILANVDQFKFKGKRNKEDYVVNQLSGEIHYSPTELSFKDLTLESDTSLLLGSLYFKYTEKNGMSNFANNVNWNLDLKDNSKISGKDIRYFVKNWNSNAVISLSSKAKGTLNNLNLTNPILSVDKTVFYAPNLLLKNLAGAESIKSFSINTNNASLQTSYTSLKSWLPNFISNKIPKIVTELGTANYKGDFLINKNDIVAKGNLISSIGLVKADAKLQNYSSKVPQYKGWIETTNLNVAPFTKSSIVGGVTSKISFEGQGFTLQQLNTKFDLKVQSININGKTVSNISSIGLLKNKLFEGKISTQDTNVALDFDGKVDFLQKVIKTDFIAAIKNINLNYFVPIVNKNTLFQGTIKSNIQFSNIDDLIGEINLNDVTLVNNNQPNYFNNIQIKTTSENGNRNFDIFSPNMITANIYGKYKLNDIPGMLREGVGSLLVNYKPKKRYDNQEFSFILDIQKNLFDLLMIDVNLSPGTTITGRYVGSNNQIQAQLISEYIYYKNIKLTNPNIFINSADSIRQFMGSLTSFKMDKTKIDKVNFSGFKRNDSLFASTNFSYGNVKEKQTEFDLNLFQTRIGNDLIFGFRPSNIDLIQAKWTLNPDFNPDEAIAKYNVITNKLTLHKIIAQSGDSKINLSGEYTSKDDFNFDLEVNEVGVEKIIPQSLLKNMVFEGMANGSAKISKTSKELKPLVDLKVEGLKFNNNPLGDLAIDATFDAGENKYIIDTKLINAGKEAFAANGFIKNEKNKPSQVDIELVADKMNIAPVGTFLQSIFSKFRGEATGNVHITGDLTNPNYQGILAMNKVGFTVNFLGVDYQLTKEQDIQISDGTFLFDNIELMDTQTKTKGTVFGVLMTKNFKEWGLNLDFSTKKLLVLNTTMKENDLFYGKVWAEGEFSISGSTNKGIEISADARALEGSNLTINSSSTTNAKDISYIKFTPEKPKEEGEEGETAAPPTGLTIRAKVSADDKSVVNLIISQETGDKVVVRGKTENLLFEMNKAGTITMDGKYTITGDSKYYYQMFVNKDFKIVPGSSILWGKKGPSEAVMDITADYTTGISNLGDYLGTTPIPNTNVTVKALLTGNLSKPSLVFNIDAEASTTIKEQLKTKFNNNEGEKMNQIAGIVVFGSFLSDKMGGSSYISSAYDVVLRQLTSIINNISSVFSLDVNFNAGNSNASNRLSSNLSLKLNPRLSVVGSVNMPLEQKSAADVWTYGAKFEYDISKNRDKSLLMSAFSKPSTFGVETSVLGSGSGNDNQSYGAGLIYKKSFNSFGELFKKKKEKNTKSDKNKPDSTIIKKESK